jgi:hypothetical protein
VAQDFLILQRLPQRRIQNTTKYSDHRTVSLIADIAKIVANIFGRKTERKIGDVLGEDAFEFRRGKEEAIQSGC